MAKTEILDEGSVSVGRCILSLTLVVHPLVTLK